MPPSAYPLGGRRGDDLSITYNNLSDTEHFLRSSSIDLRSSYQIR